MGIYILSHSDRNVNGKNIIGKQKKRCVKSLEPGVLTQNLPCSGGQIAVRCEDRRIVGEDGTCGFVSALEHLEGFFLGLFCILKMLLFTLFTFQHRMPGICRKTWTSVAKKVMFGLKVPFLGLSGDRLYVQLDSVSECG